MEILTFIGLILVFYTLNNIQKDFSSLNETLQQIESHLRKSAGDNTDGNP